MKEALAMPEGYGLGRLDLPTSRLSDMSRALVGAGNRGISPILRW